MWTRGQIKQRGKTSFKRNYWKCVLVSLIMLLLFGGMTSTSGAGDTKDDVIIEFQNLQITDNAEWGLILIAVLGVIGVSILIAAVWNIFLINPIRVGINRFFLMNTGQQATLEELVYPFCKGLYLKTVGTLFLENLFIALWTCLLVIPGIIKMYEYRMVDYILADEPEISPKECLRRSKAMMKGNKWKAFVLDVSFWGWTILSSVTCGILGVFFVNPYINATEAELYLVLKNNYPK
ncbi:MAG: DUF975 family protein [Lachnospiraceae bacterium]|nr:DUF975 family protein [Lachnospiraceae bacterium]